MGVLRWSTQTCFPFIYFVYFRENNDSTVLKSLNIAYILTYNTIFFHYSQYVELYKAFLSLPNFFIC